MMKIAIIDYEVGNLANVYNAWKRLGIEAAITRTDTGWQVTLVHAADGQKAEALLAANCGTIPYEITAGGTAP